MFSKVCVQNSVHRGEVDSPKADTFPGRHPTGQTPPGRHPSGQTPPGQTAPRAPHHQTVTAAEDMHPTGMHSC